MMKKILVVLLIVFAGVFVLHPSQNALQPQSNHVEVVDFDDDQSPDFENM